MVGFRTLGRSSSALRLTRSEEAATKGAGGHAIGEAGSVPSARRQATKLRIISREECPVPGAVAAARQRQGTSDVRGPEDESQSGGQCPRLQNQESKPTEQSVAAMPWAATARASDEAAGPRRSDAHTMSSDTDAATFQGEGVRGAADPWTPQRQRRSAAVREPVLRWAERRSGSRRGQSGRRNGAPR